MNLPSHFPVYFAISIRSLRLHPKAVLGTYTISSWHNIKAMMLWVGWREREWESCIKFMFAIWRKCSVMEHKKEREREVKRICVKDDVSMIQIDMERSVHTEIKKDVEWKRIELKVIGVGKYFPTHVSAGVSQKRHPLDRPIAFKVQIPFHCFSQIMPRHLRMETTIRTQTFRHRSRHAPECSTCPRAAHSARHIIICRRLVRAR